MFADTKAYSGFAVDDLQQARAFYGDTLGLKNTVFDEENGLMMLHLAGNRDTLVYQRPGFTPATYTILNFEVDDIDQAVDELSGRGVLFERYDSMEQDEKGVARNGGPNIAWFKDPAGNILSVLQET
jgi:catechol 2,3-dioxygenase-like lactoylglutathione lyase family enzyme